MQHPLVRTALTCLMVFGLLSFVLKLLGSIVIMVVVIVAVLAAVVIWMHEYHMPQLADLHAKPGLKQFIELVCMVSKRQVPSEELQNADEPSKELLLQTATDFWKLPRQ
ncbi:MAG: hypothetical protein R3C10_23820 [Pirellulales bacterium]